MGDTHITGHHFGGDKHQGTSDMYAGKNWGSQMIGISL